MSGAMLELEGPARERFSVRRRLGEGGFGVVYEAWDARRDELVAVKVLRRPEIASLLRFKVEFRSLADILHPNLVRLGELVSSGGIWFSTMELINGTDILRYVERPGRGCKLPGLLQSPTVVDREGTTIASSASRPRSAAEPAAEAESRELPPAELPPRQRPFDEARLRSAFAQLADGVNALHGHGLLHRDLKPSNVLVSSDGIVKILDFGLVTHLGVGDAAESPQIVGTPAYMSPEQGLGHDVGPASDWYSVGVMLFEALTGAPLFRGSRSQVLAARQKASIPRPSELVADVPPDLDELCCRLLALDPVTRPNGEEVARRLGSRPHPGAVVAPVSAGERTFVGRTRELRVLEEALEQARAGEAASVFISGASGMGKSALVRRFLERLQASDRRALVLSGRCYQRESVPYKALDGLVDELSRHLAAMPQLEAARYMPSDREALVRLFPVLAGIGASSAAARNESEIADAFELRRRGLAAVREMLGRLAADTTFVLFIDDLQWGDVDSAALLRGIFRPPDPPPLLLLVCYRREEAERSPLLRVLTRETGPEGAGWRLELGELAEDEARQLALALIGDDGADARARAEHVVRESGGIPFFVDELARFQAAGAAAGPEALRLESVLEGRYTGLPEAAQRLLEVVAVAGEPLDLEAANRAAGLPAAERNPIELLRAGQWVRPCAIEGRETFEPFHDRIRKTILSLLPAEQRPLRHRRLAEAWEAVGTAGSATLVEHYLAAGERGRAAEHARRAAGEAAAALAFERAARLYRICLDAGEWSAAERVDLLTRLAEASANAGRGEEAARAYLAATEGAEPDTELELRRRAAEQLLISGHIDEGRAVLHSVLSMAGMRLPATPRRSLAALALRRLQIGLGGTRFTARAVDDVEPGLLTRIDVCWSVAIGFGMVDNIRGAHFQARNLLLALRAGEPFRVARALSLELAFSAARGGHSRRRTAALMARCREMVQQVNDPYLNGLFALQEGAVASLEGRYAESRAACVRSESILREQCTGVTWELDTAQLYHNHTLTMMGHWAELARRVPAMLEDALGRADLYLATYLRARNTYILRLAADEVEAARAEQVRSLDGWSQRGFQVQHYWNWFSTGEIDVYAGTPAAAWERLQRHWPDFRRSLLNTAQIVWLEALLLRARVAVALAAEAGAAGGAFLRRAERDARTLAREPAVLGTAGAALIRAATAAQRGDLELAAAQLRSAADAFAACDMSHYAAAARWRLGRLLGGDEGAELLAGARAWFESQGARAPERMVDLLAPGRWS